MRDAETQTEFQPQDDEVIRELLDAWSEPRFARTVAASVVLEQLPPRWQALIAWARHQRR